MHSLDSAVHAEVAAFILHKYSKSYRSKTKESVRKRLKQERMTRMENSAVSNLSI